MITLERLFWEACWSESIPLAGNISTVLAPRLAARDSNWQRESNNPPRLLSFVTFSARNGRSGILTRCPSATPLGYALGPPNPQLITIVEEPLDFRCARISLALWLLMPTFSLPNAPRNLTVPLRCDGNALLPRPARGGTPSSSVSGLSPVNLRRKTP